MFRNFFYFATQPTPLMGIGTEPPLQRISLHSTCENIFMKVVDCLLSYFSKSPVCLVPDFFSVGSIRVPNYVLL